MILIYGPRTKNAEKDESLTVVNTTSRSSEWQGLSPFCLGPCKLYDDFTAQNVENAWQYSKLYKKHATKDDWPSEDYFFWAENGWMNSKAVRYPMGKGAKPLACYWDGELYNYIESRKKIYAPLYSAAVEGTIAFHKLKNLYEKEGSIALWDFDGYNHKMINYSYEDVINDPIRKMGHAFVLAMMLENDRAWEK